MRYAFGTGVADYVIESGAGGELLVGDAVDVYFYNAAVGGTAYTDLKYDPEDLTTIDHVTSDAEGGIPEVYGPDGILAMWADASAGVNPRRLIIARDIGAAVTQLQTDLASAQGTLTSLSTTVASLSTVASTGDYGDLIGAPTLATVATSGAYNDLTGKPSPGLQVVQKSGGTWPLRASSAPDISRIAMWIGPTPAPAFGGGYAEAGDIWWETV